MNTETQEIETKSTTEFKRKDIHQEVTDTIIKQLESGTVPWHKPWNQEDNYSSLIPQNSNTKNNYKGINIVLLWCAAMDKNYTSNEWATFKQWKEKKEAIKKDEKGSMIVYYDTFEKEQEGEIKKIPFLKHSVVFNRCQLASYNASDIQPTENTKSLVERIDLVEEFVSNIKATIEHNHSKACYNRVSDKISLPQITSFIDTDNCTATEGYYSTLMHELTHWTGHTSRLDRNLGKKFGDKNYAVEELVAELGASFLSAEFGISNPTQANHASYIASWLEVIKENKYAVLTAASEGSKATDYLHKLQPV